MAACAGAVVAAAGAGVVGPAPATAAQDPVGRPSVELPGWLGLRVMQRVDCAQAAATVQDSLQSCRVFLTVVAIQEGGPADSAGIVPGDLVARVNGRPVQRESVWRAFQGLRPGGSVQLEVVRAMDEIQKLELSLAARERPPVPEALVWRAVSRMPAPRRIFAEPGPPVSVAFREEGSVEGFATLARLLEEEYGWRDRAYYDMDRALAQIREIQGVWGIDTIQLGEQRERLSRVARLALEAADVARRLPRAFGGIEFEAVRNLDGRDGLLVLRVARGAPLTRLGLRPGDLLVRVGEREIVSMADLDAAMTGARSEETPLELTWVRQGREMSAAWPR